MQAHSTVVMDAKRVPLVAETDDSSITCPLYRAADGYCTPDFTQPIIEVKWENYPDVKLEDADESNMDYQDISIKVRVYTVCIFIY